jgi:hypothetical protein
MMHPNTTTDRRPTLELRPLCDLFAQHATPADYRVDTRIFQADVMVERLRCPVCLLPFTIETEL